MGVVWGRLPVRGPWRTKERKRAWRGGNELGRNEVLQRKKLKEKNRAWRRQLKEVRRAGKTKKEVEGELVQVDNCKLHVFLTIFTLLNIVSCWFLCFILPIECVLETVMFYWVWDCFSCFHILGYVFSSSTLFYTHCATFEDIIYIRILNPLCHFHTRALKLINKPHSMA